MTEPEYIVTDTHMTAGLSEEYQKHLFEQYGYIPELNNMVAVDEEPDD